MTLLGAVLGVLLLAVFTGCSKEELAEPMSVGPVMQTRGVTNDDNTDMGNDNNGVHAPISDDGDDLGDMERNNRPRD